jgi:hypothetical protein
VVSQAPPAQAAALDPVGVIGLGHAGLPVALRPLAAGHAVFSCARWPPGQAFLDAGGRACGTPADAHQLARQAGVRTPVLEQALAQMRQLGEKTADEPVLARYEPLASSRTHGSPSTSTQEGT